MPEKKVPTPDEFFFLPPLKMVLSSGEKESRPEHPEITIEQKTEINEEMVVKLIEKLSEKDK